jgi:hypothetical protein
MAIFRCVGNNKSNEEKQNRKNTNGSVKSVTTCKKKRAKKTAKQFPSGI